MDGGQPMSSYFLHHRGIGSPPPPPPPPPLGFRQMPPIHFSGLGSELVGLGFQVEESTSSAGGGGNVGGGIGGMASGDNTDPVKRKRGRPRKYGPEGTVSLALTTASGTGASGSVTPTTQKRGRGRPPGTGRKQQLASLGEWVAGSAGMGFTPHVITIPFGEDVAAKIMSFSQQGPRAVCILSANGAVSTVTLRQPASSGGTITYEGRFEILGLSGSYLLADDGESRSRSGGLSICLSSPDGRVIGGGVGGLLLAASPVQVIVGSFVYGGSKSKNKAKTGQESGPESDPQTGEKQSTPPNTLQNQSFSPTAMGGWHVPRQMDIRNPTIGIDLTQG